MTTCYPDSIKVKRDIQRRIEDYVIKYCETLEENFKQYSLRSFEMNIFNFQMLESIAMTRVSSLSIHFKIFHSTM